MYKHHQGRSLADIHKPVKVRLEFDWYVLKCSDYKLLEKFTSKTFLNYFLTILQLKKLNGRNKCFLELSSTDMKLRGGRLEIITGSV